MLTARCDALEKLILSYKKHIARGYVRVDLNDMPIQKGSACQSCIPNGQRPERYDFARKYYFA